MSERSGPPRATLQWTASGSTSTKREMPAVPARGARQPPRMIESEHTLYLGSERKK